MDWRELNHGLFTALLIQQIGMSFVLGLIIVVAACTVIATLIMVVLEKKKEIALLKALGAKNDAILRIFLYQGAIIGWRGTALGIFVGWLCCRFLLVYAFPSIPKVYFISRCPVSMHPVEFVIPAARGHRHLPRRRPSSPPCTPPGCARPTACAPSDRASALTVRSAPW